MSTIAELDTARHHYRTRVIPADALRVMDRAADALAVDALPGRAPTVGDTAPDFLLPDAAGRPVRLHERLADGPVILTFYRGGWCPYCNIALRGLQRELPRLRALGASLVAVSPQMPDHSLTTAEKNGLTFPVLSDVGSNVARRYGVAFTLTPELLALYDSFGHPLPASNGDGAETLPLPATFVIAPDATIRWRFLDPDYTRRADPAAVLDAVAALLS